MRKIVTILPLILFILSCDFESKKIKIYGKSVSFNKFNNYILTTRKSKNNLDFDYIHEHQNHKNLKIIYNYLEDFIFIDNDTFFNVKEEYLYKKKVFSMYMKKEIKSHNTRIFFNKNFGILATIGYGNSFLFFKDSLEINKSDLIFEEIISLLNKD